jgi:hypothetical protein
MKRSTVDPKRLGGGVPARALRVSMPGRASAPVEITAVARNASGPPVTLVPRGQRVRVAGLGG